MGCDEAAAAAGGGGCEAAAGLLASGPGGAEALILLLLLLLEAAGFPLPPTAEPRMTTLEDPIMVAGFAPPRKEELPPTRGGTEGMPLAAPPGGVNMLLLSGGAPAAAPLGPRLDTRIPGYVCRLLEALFAAFAAAAEELLAAGLLWPAKLVAADREEFPPMILKMGIVYDMCCCCCDDDATVAYDKSLD